MLSSSFSNTISSSSSSSDSEEIYQIEDIKKEPIKYKTPPINKLNSLLGQAQAYSNFLATRLKDIFIESNNSSPNTFKQPSLVTGTILKPYQLEGVQWLISLFENGLNGILADEMGLGKTVQVIGLLSFLKEMKVNGPFIIIVPLSCLSNWLKEFEKFAPSLAKDTLKYHGNPLEREKLRKEICSSTILITSFEIAMRDSTLIGSGINSCASWKYMVIDEGHRLKNMNCRLIHELKFSFITENRLLLTGTPLQNNLSELWSLLNFLLPMIFDDIDDFLSWFDPMIDGGGGGGAGGGAIVEKEEMVQRLHNILKPLLLRRLKKEVEMELPEKIEYLIKVPLSLVQISLYNSIIMGKLREWLGDSLGHPFIGGSLMNRTMQLRKACNHAFLFENGTKNLTLENIFENGSKMRVLDQILTKRIALGHKILIFSQMSKMLDIISMYLDLKEYSYSRLDGSISHVHREEEIDAFRSSENNISIFLLSTRAGGLGINLIEADTVIFYDSDWNPQVDLQAQDRAHRIGQKKKVLIIRLCSPSPSIEEGMIARAIKKRHLEKVIIHSKKFKGKRSLMDETNLDLDEDEDFEQMLRNDADSIRRNIIDESSSSSSSITISILENNNCYTEIMNGNVGAALSEEELEIFK